LKKIGKKIKFVRESIYNVMGKKNCLQSHGDGIEQHHHHTTIEVQKKWHL